MRLLSMHAWHVPGQLQGPYAGVDVFFSNVQQARSPRSLQSMR